MRDKRPALPISGAPHATLRNPGVAWENRRTPPGLSHKVGPAQPGGAPPLEGPGATPLPAARGEPRPVVAPIAMGIWLADPADLTTYNGTQA